MRGQFPHAVKSFESQKYNNMTWVMIEVDTAFNNASDPKNPIWLIRWVIKNTLVCNITFDFLF
jgi:hypothetical protein